MITSGRSLISAPVAGTATTLATGSITKTANATGATKLSGTIAPGSGKVLRPGSVVIAPSAGAGAATVITDNGDGTLTAKDAGVATGSGVVNYTTGVFDVTTALAVTTVTGNADTMDTPAGLGTDPNDYFRYLYSGKSNSNDLPQMIVVSNKGSAGEVGVLVQRVTGSEATAANWKAIPKSSCSVKAGATAVIYPTPGKFDGYRIIASHASGQASSTTVDCSLVFEISDNGQ